MDPSLSKSLDPPPPPPLPFHPPTIITTTTTAAAAAADQILNHTAHVANPTPSLPQTLNHPPYSEMISAAIVGLKERDGSSKRAIAKYIEKVYTDLPPTHSALLTHHLKRLKNNGHLVMVKKSYKLPTPTRSDAPASNPNNISAVPLTVSATGPPKKGRGRPSKPKPTDAAGPLVVPDGPVQQQPTTLIKRGPGRPPKNGPIVPVGPTVSVSAVPVLGKKGRGRPPKTGPIGPKKSPGRPRKPKSLAAPNGLKRGRGRPPKALSQAQPPKAMIVPYAAAAAAPGAQNALRPRGRPKKSSAAIAAAVVAVGGGVVMGKPRGRPPKVDGVIKPHKPRNTAGRPVGRPKKNAAESQVAYADLKRKLDIFQSKVKQAVGVLKPQFTSESDISAIAAIQELEGLAAMDISTPFREEPQPQPPLLQN